MPGRDDRREHGVEAGPVREPQVDVGRGVVEPPTAGGGEPLGQSAHGLVVGKADAGPLEPGSAVDPHLARRR